MAGGCASRSATWPAKHTKKEAHQNTTAAGPARGSSSPPGGPARAYWRLRRAVTRVRPVIDDPPAACTPVARRTYDRRTDASFASSSIPRRPPVFHYTYDALRAATPRSVDSARKPAGAPLRQASANSGGRMLLRAGALTTAFVLVYRREGSATDRARPAHHRRYEPVPPHRHR